MVVSSRVQRFQSGIMQWLLLFVCLLACRPNAISSQSGMVQAWTYPLLMKTSPAVSRRKTSNGGPKSSFAGKRSNSNAPTRKRRGPGASSPNDTRKKQRPKGEAQSPPPASKTKPKSIGEAVQQAEAVPELLEVASQLWLPTDPDLPGHLRTQALHHERRQRWSSQLVSKLGAACLRSVDAAANMQVWQDERFERAVLAAALPFPSEEPIPLSDKDLRTLREGLIGLHTLVGLVEPRQFANLQNANDMIQGIRYMLERAESNADKFVLPEAMEVRWAARGILRKLGNDVAPNRNIVQQESNGSNLQSFLASAFPQLEERAQGLPFDILPIGVDFSNLDWLEEDIDRPMESQEDVMTSLQQSIPFQFDTIVTRHGASVTERRGTAWVAEEGIGALAYSGKLMPPATMPPLVRNLMTQVEAAVDVPTNGFFDCALCNYYPDGDSACKFHTDPEHGTMWERLNCVVSLGNSRRFAFRPIPDETTWSEWDESSATTNEEDCATVPAVIRLFPGDVVSMWGECNDLFHHAVYPESETQSAGNDARRVSLVLKRAMVNGKGRRGHGLAGEGRRSRHKKSQSRQ